MFQPETTSAQDGPSKETTYLMSWVNLFFNKFAAPVAQQTAEPAGPLKRKYPKPTGYKKYTYSEIAKHSTPDDAWVIVDDGEGPKVYDVSAMKHPGGDVVYSYAGRDATEAFRALHKNPAAVRPVLKAHLIGEVDVPEQAALLRDFHEMVAGFKQKGLLDASAFYYTRKFVEVLAMLATVVYLLANYSDCWAAVAAACVLQGTMFLQCGWLQHDFNHNAVFTSHKTNYTLGSIVVGLGLGGSSHWWKTKHNQHHATPNKMSHDDKTAVDPDIDTVPLIAWSEALLRQVNVSERGIISAQQILVWPLLLLAHINWQIQSFNHAAFIPNIPKGQRRWELTLILIHHAYVNAIAFGFLGFTKGLVFWALSHFLSGFLIGFIFIQSHNGMEIYNDDKDFVTSQLVSTRNIDPGLVCDWVCGGLNYQIEHHLFPTMPRHSFSRARKGVMELCAKHGLPYESCGMWESTTKVYRQLATIAKLA